MPKPRRLRALRRAPRRRLTLARALELPLLIGTLVLALPYVACAWRIVIGESINVPQTLLALLLAPLPVALVFWVFRRVHVRRSAKGTLTMTFAQDPRPAPKQTRGRKEGKP